MVAGHLREKSGYYYAVLNYTDSLGKKKDQVDFHRAYCEGKQKKRAEAIMMDARRNFKSRRAEDHERRHPVRGLYGKSGSTYIKSSVAVRHRFILDYG